ncbi:MFS transporter, partial [Proteus mirabilis]|nr:MFS transporter [Proteus mirabilis]
GDSASILNYFYAENAGSTVDNFHDTIITVGAITLLSSFFFLVLNKHDGDNLTTKKKNEN